MSEIKPSRYDYVKNYIESFGFSLLSTTYTNNKEKLPVMCPKGHEYSVKFGNFNKGSRCPVCAGKKKYTYDYVKSYIESTGYTLLSDSYINAHGKLLVECLNDHEYITNFNTFNQGHRCSKCMNTLNGKSRSLDYEYVKSYIESFGYTLLSDTYKNNCVKLLTVCPNGHKYSVKFGAFKDSGHRCSTCDNKSSKAEIDVQNYIESLGIPIVRNDRTQIVNPLTGRNLELDIWIPSMSKAIEYNGLYWHSFIDREKLDKIKQEQCQNLGIKLLIINEYNWIDNQEFEKRIIRNFIDE